MKYLHFSIIFIFLLLNTPSQVLAQSPCAPNGPQEGCLGCGGDSTKPPNYPRKQFDIPVRRASDPNELDGSPGYATGHWISLKDKLQFTVHFENDPKFATAPATNVFITVPVHAGINPATLNLGPFGFGHYLFQPPINSSAYSDRLDLTDSLGIYLDVIAGIDIAKNEVFWTFKSIDPATGQQPVDPMRGFLPVNDTSAAADTAQGIGEGFVSFVVGPKSSLVTGDTVTAKAGIVFDVNAAIPTNVWLNSIDAFGPTTSVKAATAAHDTITLRYSGMDDAGGTGVAGYALYYSENGSPFQLYQANLTDTVATFIGTMGKIYGFFSIGTDNVGNVEQLKNSAEKTVSLTGMGVPLPITWLLFEGHLQGGDVLLNWAVSAERNCQEYIVERSLDGQTFTEIGIIVAVGNSLQTLNYDFTDPEVAKLNVKRLYYRIRQVALDGSRVYSKTVSVPISSNPLDAARVTASPNPFATYINLQVMNIVSSGKRDNVELYSMDGRLRYQRSIALSGGTAILLADLPPLEQGLYILKVSIEGRLYTVKMERR